MKMIKLCEHEPQLVYSIGSKSTSSVNYYASDGDNVYLFKGDLIINLSREPGLKVGSNVWNYPTLAQHMIDIPEEICLMWYDFGTPPVKPSFWMALHEYALLKGYKNICFHCGHGHGRTGTAVCSMMVANGIKADLAIKKLRKKYCKYAVESEVQVYYLLSLDEELNGRNLPDSQQELEEQIKELSVSFNIINHFK